MAARRPRRRAPARQGHGPRLVIATTDPGVAAQVRHAALALGYDPVEVRDGGGLQAALARRPVEALVLDPALEGLWRPEDLPGLTRHLALALTRRSAADVELARELGAALLPTPVDARRLRRALPDFARPDFARPWARPRRAADAARLA